MEGCKYCSQEADGGVLLFGEDASLGELGTLEVESRLWNFCMDLKPRLYTSVWFNCGTHDSHTLVEEEVGINFCPFCGRNLKELT